MSDYDISSAFLCCNRNYPLSADQDPALVWRVDLDVEAKRVSELERSLSPDEAARADRFYCARDRRRFIAARGALRAVLSEYLHVEADQIRFSYTPDQKPILAHPILAPEATLCFNVSHSDALALIAVARGLQVGVDLERLRSDFDPNVLAKRFFSPVECDALSRASPEEKHRDFLSYWVCKEAYLKACGTGLRHPLSEFTVSLEDHSVQLIGPTGQGKLNAPYRLQSFSPAPGYVAAIAIQIL